MSFLLFQLINPQTGKPEDEAYVDADQVSTWQSMKTKYDKPCTLINFKSGMGFAYQVNATFNEVSARILEARGQSADAKHHKELADGAKVETSRFAV
jgi:hypothetical protein